MMLHIRICAPRGQPPFIGLPKVLETPQPHARAGLLGVGPAEQPREQGGEEDSAPG